MTDSGITPEIRDKIIETHTLVKRMDKEHDEHKVIVNARIIDMKKDIEDLHGRTEKIEHFKTKFVSYAVILAGLGGLLIEFLSSSAKKVFGL